jgi:cysteine desulfurase/selenocysteine lyase
LEAVFEHEKDLMAYALEKIRALDRVVLYGNTPARCGVISFNLENAHPYDVGMVLDKYGIAVRTGMHCAEPLMAKLGVSGTIRASFALYNTREEIDKLLEGLEKALAILDL